MPRKSHSSSSSSCRRRSEDVAAYIESLVKKETRNKGCLSWVSLDKLQDLADADNDVHDFLERHHLNCLIDFLNKYSDRFYLRNGQVSSNVEYLTQIERTAVAYFSDCLKNYNQKYKAYIHNFRGHVGQASADVRDFINGWYPGNEFEIFLMSHQDVFYLSANNAISLKATANEFSFLGTSILYMKNDDDVGLSDCASCKIWDNYSEDRDVDCDHEEGSGKYKNVDNQGEQRNEKNNGTAAKSSSDIMELDDVISDFEKLLRDQASTDIVLHVGKEVLPAHKLILGARSSVFAAMFAHSFKESTSNVVTIPDISPPVMKDFLQFIYTGKVKDISTEKAVRLYQAADKYDIKRLKEKCRDILISSFTIDSVCEKAVFADVHNDGKLLDAVKIFIHKNVNAILPTKSWSDLILKNCRLGSEILLAVTTQIAKSSQEATSQEDISPIAIEHW